MRHDFATTAAQTDIPEVGAARRYETKNWNELKEKELLRKNSRLVRITIKNEDQTRDQNNGLEAKSSKGEIRISLKIDLAELPLLPIRISLQNQTLHMGKSIPKLEDLMINAKICHSTETMEIDLQTDFSTVTVGTGETMEFLPVLHRFRGETSHKKFSTANQQINLTILLSADLTIDLRLVLRPMNKSFRNTTIKRHLLWFASTQPTILLTNCHISAR